MGNTKYTDDAVTTLSSGLTAIATSMIVASNTNFTGLASSPTFFYATLVKATNGAKETVKVTDNATTTWTIARAQGDGESALAFDAADEVSLRVGENLLDAFAHLDDLAATTGAELIGATDGGTVQGHIDKTRIFDTKADMVAATDLVVGGRARTIGYTTVDDGGGNDYDIVAAATSTDDGGSYIDLATHQAKGLFPDNLISRNQFDDDTKFDTYVAAATEFSEFDMIGFFSKGNAATGISTSARGLLIRQLVANLSSGMNVCPNGTVSTTNAAKAIMRLWDIDIRANTTAARRAGGFEIHHDSDAIDRFRMVSRSEGISPLKHMDYYWQINGNNCLYIGCARGGKTLSAVSIGVFPLATSFKVDFATTTGTGTGVTNYWAASTVYAATDEVALLGNDYQYLLCTTGGTSGATEPGDTIVGGNGQCGTTGVAEGPNTLVWTVRSRLQEGGNVDAKPSWWADESGKTGFGTMNPQEIFDFANDINLTNTASFEKIIEHSTTIGITAAGTSSLDNATALTTHLNQVTTVAADSGVRLATAVAGQKQSIKNDGANPLKVWPTSGDDLGAGVNTNIILAIGEYAEFHCKDATNWYRAFDGQITVTDTVEISSAEILALVTPVTLVAAKGADTVIEFVSALLIHDAGTAYVEPSAPDDLVIQYATTGTDLSASIDSTGFLDQVSDEARLITPSLAITVDLVAEKNNAIELFNTGANLTTGTGTMTVKISYRVHNLGL